MEKVKFFYGELLVNSDCNLECSMKFQCKDMNHRRQLEWSEAKKTLEEYSDIVHFDYIGISGGEPLNHPEIKQFIFGLRQLYKNSPIIFITDGKKLLLNSNIINYLIERSPAKLCIVLQKDWSDFSYQLDQVVKILGYRFMKLNSNNPIKGIKYILLKKNISFDIELYIHVPVKFETFNTGNLLINQIDIKSIFPNCHERKSMPVLSERKIFKCRNAKRLWDYSNNNNVSSVQYLIDDMLEDAIVNNRREIYKLEYFYKKGKICELCQGCIECIVFQKGSTNR